MFEMTYDALTDAGKHVTSNIASVPNQRHLKIHLIGPNDVRYDVV